MKRLFCWLAIVWLVIAGAQAEEIVIEGFDLHGNLTFNTISNAQSYRIEWAPRDGSPWTNFQAAAEMLDEIAASSDPTITVEVPFRYRVVASVTNAPPSEGEYLVIDVSAGPSASSYPVSSLTAVPPGGWTDEYKTTKFVLRRIPAGTFVMGSPTDELGRFSNETQHTVTLTKDFYIGVFQVTQKQWERVMGDWPSWFNNATYRESRPVETVSYYDIRENPNNTAISPNWPQSNQVGPDSFMGRLRARTGLTFDLPTESQWEYACRAGTTMALNSGYNLTSTESDPRMDEVGRYFYNHPGGYSGSSSVSTDGGTATVGTYLPNEWGLYDMHGNVWEWCLDWYGGYPGTVTDPVGAASGSFRVKRGGSWSSFAGSCRSAYRNLFTPSLRDFDFGFRLSRTLP